MDSSVLIGAASDEFSLISMFIKADLVVRLVMLMLAIASIWSWSVAADKWIGMGLARRKARRIEASVADGQFPEDYLPGKKSAPSDAMARIYAAGARTLREGLPENDTLSPDTVERARNAMGRAAVRETVALERGLGVLAIIGSTSPFIGLFGTVWGIMNSFRAIAASRETNLAVVAPGIAEALFATALGLIAAIPAVVFYNKFSSETNSFSQRMHDFADEFIFHASRTLHESDAAHQQTHRSL